LRRKRTKVFGTAQGILFSEMAGDEATQPLIESHASTGTLRGAFTSSAAVLLVVLLALFAILVEYPADAATDAQVGQYYWW